MPDVPVCPVKDCSLPVDIVLRSSDKCLIGAHKGNLAHFSEAFPASDSVTHTDGPVDLLEDGETLKLLMQFMHHQRLPTLSDKTISGYMPSLLALAGAAEKYLVYSAMALCNVRIADMYRCDELESLTYAVKFNYPDLANAAAPHTLGKDLEAVIRCLGQAGQDAIIAWVRYRENWIMVAEGIIHESNRPRALKSCCPETGHWDRFRKAVLDDLPKSQPDFMKAIGHSVPYSARLENVVEKHLHILNCCGRGLCRYAAERWMNENSAQLRNIPGFTTFLAAT